MGTLRLRRRWWGSRCACAPGGYVVDECLGLDGYCTRLVQQQLCRLAADLSFEKGREHLWAFWQLPLSAETLRRICHTRAERMVRWQAQDESTPNEFIAAPGAVEFTVDAGKVHTREKGWKDLKIGVFQKRPPGPSATANEWMTRSLPAPTACVAWAAVQPVKQFRRSWRRWSRRLGVAAAAELHVLADGAGWIWRAVERVFTGCQQTLDIYHACQHLAQAGERLYGPGTEAARAFLEQSRQRLLESGWPGICEMVGQEYTQGDTSERRSALEKLVGYFVKHYPRLNYPARLANGQPIGSGAVEGWAKTLGLRLKARGARWRFANVRRMATLGCIRNSHQWPNYWAAA